MRFLVRLIPALFSSLLLGVALSSASALAQSAYTVSQANGVGITPGSTQVTTNTCADDAAPNDDCVGTVALPFSYTFYGQTFTTANVSTNGVLQFTSASTDYGQNQICFPLSQFNNAIFAHWTDMQTNGAGEGIFTSVSGTPGNQVFNIEWRASYDFLPPGSINFEIRLYEGQQRFDIVYGNVGGSGTSAPGSGIAVPAVGAQNGGGTAYTAFSSACGVAGGGLRNGLALTFTGSSNSALFIAGRVTDPDGNPLSGVNVSLSGDTNTTTLTDQTGRYSFDNLGGSNYTVAASQGSAAFFPASRSYGANSFVAFSGSQIVNFVRTPAPASGDLLISEFRFRGPEFFADEFVELYNNTNSAIVVNTSDGTSGWLVQAANPSPAPPDGTGGLASYILPRGTVIPARTHFLIAGHNYSSLFRYAPGEDFFNKDIPDDSGVSIFSTTNLSNLNTTTRLDAVGFTPADALYREGAGLAPVGAFNGEHSFVRRLNSGIPQDTNDNAADFVFVSTGAEAPNGVQAALGAPGPEDLYSPVQRNTQIKVSYIDVTCVGYPAPSNDPTTACARVRVGSGNSGTLSIRRRWTNRTNTSINSLRFRVVDMTTYGNRGAADADLRVLSSSDTTVTGANGPVTLKSLTLEQSPPSQPGGGGVNSSLRAGAITLSAPLSPGASINLEFRLAVQLEGNYRFFVNVEAQTGPAPPPVNGSASGASKTTGGYPQQSTKSLPGSIKQ
ncbi:MAG: hypothetical protein QOE33_1301 [Acidobacteriota bacterium]|nr:hypothetical protein [Acidobacteriota bacterium]